MVRREKCSFVIPVEKVNRFSGLRNAADTALVIPLFLPSLFYSILLSLLRVFVFFVSRLQ